MTNEVLIFGCSLFFKVWNFVAPKPWIGVAARETSLGKILFEPANIYSVLKA